MGWRSAGASGAVSTSGVAGSGAVVSALAVSVTTALEAVVSVAAAADYFRVSWPTAKQWSDRYRALLEGSGQVPTAAAMIDRSSRPHRSPTRTPVA